MTTNHMFSWRPYYHELRAREKGLERALTCRSHCGKRFYGWEKADPNVKTRAQIIFVLLLIAFFALFVYQAKDWRLQARLYPWAIGIPMLVLALVQLVLDLRGIAPKKSRDSTPVDFQFTQNIDPILARSRTINIFSWVCGFIIGIWLLGFSITVPLFVFLYLKVQSREGWPLSIALTAGVWLFFWGLFDRLLRLPFPDGELLTWLGLS